MSATKRVRFLFHIPRNPYYYGAIVKLLDGQSITIWEVPPRYVGLTPNL